MSYFAPQGTFFGISTIANALQAFQVAENVTADNISNVNTPGASRQRVIFTQAQPIVGSPGADTHTQGTIGQGVLVQQIQSIHDNSFDALFRGANSSQNYFTTQQNVLNGIQTAFGDPNSGVNAQYSAFQAAINQLQAQVGSGQSLAVRQNVLQQAQALTTSLNTASNTITQQQSQLLTQGSGIVTTVNGLLDQIAALNGHIRALTAVGDQPNTFTDQRNQLIDQLSQYVPVQTAIQSDGSTLVTVNGQALVNDQVAYHLATPVIGTLPNGEPTFKVDFATTPPALPSAAGVPLGNGQLGAVADLFNGKLAPYLLQLNNFAATLSTEVNRVTQDGYDANGNAGGPLFVPVIPGQTITAASIRVGISQPLQLPAALASTAAGTLVGSLNSANNTVDITAAITNNATLLNAPTAALAGNLTVSIGGAVQTFAYTTGVGGNSSTIADFISNFNNAHLGVTASYNTVSQKIAFARDPSNEDLAFRAAHTTQASDPTFQMTDSNYVAATPNTSLLGALNAGGINAVTQNSTNAFGANDNGAASALVNLFSQNLGFPPVQFNAVPAAVAGTPYTVALPPGVTGLTVGSMLTIDAQPGGVAPQENVSVSAISLNPTTGIETITFTPANNHAGPFSITTAQQQTLTQTYGNLVTQIGLDGQTANQGVATQTSLASNIDKQRQSISGINIDEESQNLITFQNAYTAAARTMSIMDQMLQTIINNIGPGR